MELTRLNSLEYRIKFESPEQEQLILDTIKNIQMESLKAKDVMAILGISRQTLSRYVKRGIIKTDSDYTGKQYRYNYESVIKLKEGN